MKKWLLAVMTAALIAPAAPAQSDAGNMADKIINTGSWNVSGAKSSVQHDDKVQGGLALRIKAEKGINTWDAAASVAISKPVKKGDVLLAAFWARVETPPAGKTTATIAAIIVQLSQAPYTGLFSEPAEIGGEWAMYYASGVADKDYEPGQINLGVQLAAATQTVDLGPVMIIDWGPDFDRSKLPHNKLASAAPPAATTAAAPPPSLTAAEARFAAELKKLRAQLPVKGTLIADPGMPVTLYGPDQTNQPIAAPEVPGGNAVRIVMAKRGEDAWSDGASLPISGDIHKGDTVLAAVYARATEVNNEAQSGVIQSMGIQLTRSPWSAFAGTAAMVPHNEWRVLYVSGVADANYAAGDVNVSFQIGCCKQTLDIGPIFVLNLGPGVALSALPANRISYPGREANAPWRAAAEARIKQLRMGGLRVLVTDASGKPVPNATVHFAMQRHRFHFGGFAGYDLAAPGPDGDRLRQQFLSHFNFATSPIYWSDWGWQNPQTRDTFIATARWLNEHNYSFRGHPILYGNESGTPSYIRKLAGDPAAVNKAVLDHVREVVTTVLPYGVTHFDIFNEPRDCTYLPGISSQQTVIDAFKTAHQLAPKAELFVNEYGIVSGGGTNEKYIAAYRAWIADMLAKGAPISGIGIQGHFGAQLTDPARVLAILDDFARFKQPVEITEFDIDTTDEQAQADYTRDMLTTAFSHPAVDAFVTWDWRGPASNNRTMFRTDGSEKPNGKAWTKLIYHDWWTDETRTAGADGAAQLRAFYGDYKITVSAGGKTLEHDLAFGPDSGPVPVVLK